jgi:hypothetical protein
LIIDVDAISLVGRNFPADNDFGNPGILRIEAEPVQFGLHIGLEDRFDNGAAFAAANEAGRSLRAGKQAESIDDDGFTGAGFTGKKIEAFFKVQFEQIDESEITNAQKPQHTRASYMPSGVDLSMTNR